MRGERPRIEDYAGRASSRDSRAALLSDLLAAELETPRSSPRRAARAGRVSRPAPRRADGDRPRLRGPRRPDRRAGGCRGPTRRDRPHRAAGRPDRPDRRGDGRRLRAWVAEQGPPVAEILASQGTLDDPRRTLLEALAAEPRAARRRRRRSLASLRPAPVPAIGLARRPRPDSTGPSTRRWCTRDAPAQPGADGYALAPPGRRAVPRPQAARPGRPGRRLRRPRRGAAPRGRPQGDPRPATPTTRTAASRFLLEAEITGGLEHPGIVPVYGLGTYADGRPVLRHAVHPGREPQGGHRRASTPTRRTRGDPGRRALALRKLLRRFLDVCNAVAYAHSRGVLHRDLKPGNIMLGRYGETLVVDWGLAKVVGRRGERAGGGRAAAGPCRRRVGLGARPLPGSRVGTPAYMSPEQAAGRLDRLGPRADVYSLGATLYCPARPAGRRSRSATSASLIARRCGAGYSPRRGRVTRRSTGRWRRSA